ncbi:MAG: diacylglycerol kinase family lipid kinase [Ktedonobacteraceae bacterium]|nr:diacylglycerol kinase family lipid kinase [Ktedonobacteraceae bacterium]
METAKSSAHPLVILNPFANRGKIHSYRALLRPYLEQEQAEYIETGRSGEARNLAIRAADEGRAVIIVGGDGSIHEVANGILSTGKRVPLGIIPAGSGNDYAWHALKLPRDPADALERAFHGRLIEMDAGRVNNRFFVNAFGVGLDANIAAAANELKRFPFMSGSRLYYTATLQQLLFGYARCPWLTFHLDSGAYEQAVEKRYVLLTVSNGSTYGAGFHINPGADPGDGLFDVCAIDYAPLLRALKLLPVVKRGEHAELPEVTFYRAKTVRIESRQEVNILMDGETNSGTSFDVQILPGALWVRV